MVFFLNFVGTFAYLAMAAAMLGALVGAVPSLLWPILGMWGTLSLAMASVISRMPPPLKDNYVPRPQPGDRPADVEVG